MALNVDTTRAFRTPGERELLVQAVLCAEPPDEAHWIEWKSPPALLRPEFAFKIAKSILGFANRSPDAARRVAEGTAYLILGAGPRAACPGVEVVDGAKLAQALNPYLGGADGPRWSPDYVTIDGKSVLVITVEAPREGDGIYTLHRAYDNFHAGIIFHRGVSQTEPALPGDVRQLEERLLSGHREPAIAIDVQVSAASCLQQVDVSDTEIERWLRRREAALEALLPRPPSRRSSTPPRGTFDRVANLNKVNVGKFRQEAREHLDTCRSRLPLAAEATLHESGLNELSVSVENPTDVTVPDVELRLVFDARVVHIFDVYTDDDFDLPAPPRPRALFEGLYDLQIPPIPPLYKTDSAPPIIRNPIIKVDNGNVVAVYRIGNVRPHGRVQIGDVTLIVDRQEDIRGTWTATSTGQRGQVQGTVVLPVADDLISIDIVGDPAKVGDS